MSTEVVSKAIMVMVVSALMSVFLTSAAIAVEDDRLANQTHPPELVDFVAGQAGTGTTEANELLTEIFEVGDVFALLRSDAPSGFAGAWIDPKTFRPTIAVTPAGSETAFRTRTRQLGYEGRLDVVRRTHSVAALRDAARLADAVRTNSAELLGRRPTSLRENEMTGTIDILVSSRVPSSSVSDFRQVLEKHALPVRVQTVPENEIVLPPAACSFPNCDRPLRAATGISGPSYSSTCSGGFFAKSASYRYYVTAGHCRQSATSGTAYYAKAPSYYNSSTGNRSWLIGNNLTALTSVGPYDYMAIRINTSSFWWATTPGGYFSDWGANASLSSYPSARVPLVGEPTCRYGITSMYACGTITQSNTIATVGPYNGTYFQVNGAFRSNACGIPGDSGGPFLGAGRVLFGITSGATPCATIPGQPSSGSSTGQQATTALSAMGLTLVAGP